MRHHSLLLLLLAIFACAASAQQQTDREIEARLQTMLGPGKGYNNLDASEGAFLRDLVVKLGAKRVLEVGTSTGYSGIWMAMGLRGTGGKLITIEYNQGRYDSARENFRAVGLSEIIDARLGDALEEVPKVPGPLDLVFLDARQTDNLKYFEIVSPKVRRGGIIVAHNVKSHPQLMAGFLARIQSDPSVKTEIVAPGWQGFSVTVVK
jgi:caffeoyl-CoA O-methyltransferase